MFFRFFSMLFEAGWFWIFDFCRSWILDFESWPLCNKTPLLCHFWSCPTVGIGHSKHNIVDNSCIQLTNQFQPTHVCWQFLPLFFWKTHWNKLMGANHSRGAMIQFAQATYIYCLIATKPFPGPQHSHYPVSERTTPKKNQHQLPQWNLLSQPYPT